MSLSYGELLYGYVYLDIDIDENVFKDSDTKEFIRSMKRMPKGSLDNCEFFGDIAPRVISKDAFLDNYNNMIYNPLVNERVMELQTALLRHDWNYLADKFPETCSLAYKPNSSKNPKDLILDEYTFFSFFPEWDKGFKGLRNDDFIVFYAPPKHGKSTVTAYLAFKAIESGIPIGFYPTELSISVTLKYILGFALGLRGNEALAYFDGYIDQKGQFVEGHKKEFNELIEEYNHLIHLPPTNIFNYNDYESLYLSDAQFIFHDNFVRSLSQLGLNEDASSASQFSRRLSTIQQKYTKCTFLVTQEAMRECTPKEQETNPGVLEVGKGYTAISRSLLQECSLAFNVRAKANSATKELIVKNDRFRGLMDLDTQMFASISNRGKLVVNTISDSMTKSLDRLNASLEKELL